MGQLTVMDIKTVEVIIRNFRFWLKKLGVKAPLLHGNIRGETRRGDELFYLVQKLTMPIDTPSNEEIVLLDEQSSLIFDQGLTIHNHARYLEILNNCIVKAEFLADETYSAALGKWFGFLKLIFELQERHRKNIRDVSKNAWENNPINHYRLYLEF